MLAIIISTPARTTQPKHRADVTARHGSMPDHASQARCTRPGASMCMTICPRHRPVDYVECMARHVSDVYGTGSIGFN